MSEKMQINGNVKISDDVIATIANIAMSEIKGVAKKFSNPESKNLLGKKSIAKGVRVAKISDDVISLEVDVTIIYGAKLVEVAWEIQDNVKRHVESMTGLTVDKVNVHITNVELEKQETPSKSSFEENVSEAPDKVE